MNGQDILKARQALGWNRPQLAGVTGFTVAQIARMERSGTRTADEDESMRRALTTQLGQVLVKGQPIPVPPAAPIQDGTAAPEETAPVDDWDTGTRVLHEWRGLKKGDIVRLEGDSPRARFRFDHYFHSPAQEYVQLYSVRNGGSKPVRPDRVRTLQNKPLPKEAS